MRNYTKLAIQSPEKLFFTSDLHFFHEGIINHCDRPFKDAQEMGEMLIRNWNAIIPPDGQVFVLGDMFWKKGEVDKCKKIMSRLAGKKWLIAGNHDLWERDAYIDMGFEDARDYLEIHIGWKHLILSHYPMLEWNGFYHGTWHLHGHSHGRSSHFSCRVMDVGVDAHNYMPVAWREIDRDFETAIKLDEEAMEKRGNKQRHQPYKF